MTILCEVRNTKLFLDEINIIIFGTFTIYEKLLGKVKINDINLKLNCIFVLPTIALLNQKHDLYSFLKKK